MELPILATESQVKNFVDSLATMRKYVMPRLYSLPVVTIPANSSVQRELKISSEGPFLIQSICSEFDFVNSLPTTFVEIIDKSNSNKSLTSEKTPMNIISSNGKTGNQLFEPFAFVHLIKTNGSLIFNFENTGAEEVTLKLALNGYQFTVKEN